MKVLIIEDDPDVVEVVGRQLTDLGYELEHIADGRAGLERALAAEFALVIIDLQLPSLGGLEICRALRAEKSLQPILILTGDTEQVNTVVGLELGADEYIHKPFDRAEFRARVRALLRRVEAVDEERKNLDQDGGRKREIRCRDLLIELDRRRVTVGERQVHLTPIEFDILYLLASDPDRVFSREELLNEIWGYDAAVYEQNIRTHVSKLRAKLEIDGTEGPYVLTKRGYGYYFASAGGETEK